LAYFSLSSLCFTIAETPAKFLAYFCSSVFGVSVLVVDSFLVDEEVKLLKDELRVFSRSEPRETPFPLNALNELFFSSSGGELLVDALVV